MALFEACVDSVESAANAIAGGAGRLELCDALVDGGVTPSHGKIATVLRLAGAVPVHVLIRPRPGDFVYSPDELAVMLEDIEHVKSLGAAGIVSGALSPDGSVDVQTTRALVDATRPLRFTFHRAIDAAADLPEAFEACIALGVDFVLTSGGAATALAGADRIRSMVQRAAALPLQDAASVAVPATAAPRPALPTVIAGGGVSDADVAAAVLVATGVRELHGTLRRLEAGPMRHRPDPPIYMGGEKKNSPEVEFGRRVADTGAVAAVVCVLRRAASSEGVSSGSEGTSSAQ